MDTAVDAGLWRPALSLCQRELVRFVRQKHRIVGALATPIVFWLMLGGGFTSAGGLRYFFPGTVVMILLFTAIFSTISIIEDRREGFLQSVLVAPISPMVIVLGKVLGGSVLAFGQGLIFLALAPLIGVHISPAGLLLALAVMWIVSFGLTALGFCIAWRMSSTQGFHAIMNLFLMPMWALSGALFPAQKAWIGLRWAMEVNPLTYGLAALRQALNGPEAGLPALGVSLTVSVVAAVLLFASASWMATRSIEADWQ